MGAGIESPPPKSPRESLRSIRVQSGFTVQLVAAEPLVEDPIAFDWDPDGSLWVVEMGDYPQGLGARHGPGGRVRHLEDTDGDGVFDRSTVLLAGLSFPTAVMAWRGGVLVAAAPLVFYAKDTTGDGRADRRETLFSGFEPGNPQHRVNSFARGLDNWVYLANGDNGGIIRSRKTGKKVAIGGRDLRIRPDDGALDPQTGWSQYGRSRDDWGNWFGTVNELPIIQFVLADQQLRRNPFVMAPPGRTIIASSGNTGLYPISRVLSHWEGYHPPPPGQPYRFTAACSTIVYRDTLFGADFRNNTFTSEPAYNLVHRRILKPRGLTFTSVRPRGEEASEFLASTDCWFRPTTIRVGPDGALWIADMYRLVIEHPDWIDDQLERKLDLRAGAGMGRIYRVYPTAHPPRPMPRLDQMDTAALVTALASPSGWQRDMVQQMLVWRRDRGAIEPLRKMARGDPRPRARLHALCTLDGLGGLTPDLIAAAMRDPHPGVRRHGVRLSSSFLRPASAATRPLRAAASSASRPAGAQRPAAEVVAALLRRANDRDPHVRLECAYALGDCGDPRAAQALATMAVRDADNPYLLAAILSSVNRGNLARVLAGVFSRPDTRIPPGPLVRRLLSLATAIGDRHVLVRALARVGTPKGDACATWQLAALNGIFDALERQRRSLLELGGNPRGKQHPLPGPAFDPIGRLFRIIRRIAVDPGEDPARRSLAVELLGRGPDRPGERDVLRSLLVPQTPAKLQQAVVESLGRQTDPQVAATLLAHWRASGQGVRRTVLDVLFRRQAWQAALIAAIERGTVLPSDIDATHRYLLLTHKDRGLRGRAEAVFAMSATSSRAPILRAYRPVLDLPGNVRRGAELFQQKCSACHQVATRGHRVGPDLMALVDRSPTHLLTAILDPNRSVAQTFQTYLVVTDQGRQFAGILTDDSGRSITLLDQDGTRHVVPRAHIEELVSTGQSLMPEGFEKDLNRQQLADVIAYVSGLGTDPKIVPGNRPRGVRSSADGCLTLRPATAAIFGGSLTLRPKHGALGPWSAPGDRAVWSLKGIRGGRYAVWMDITSGAKNDHRVWLLETGAAELRVPVARVRAQPNDPFGILAGYLELTPGDQRLAVRMIGADQRPAIQLGGVILVPVSGTIGAAPRRLFHGNQPRLLRAATDGQFRLPANAAEIFGETLSFAPKRGGLVSWLSANDRAVWTLHAADPGTFLVFLDYSCADRSAGNTFTLRAGRAHLTARVRGTRSWTHRRSVLAGPIRLAAGTWRLAIGPTGPPRGVLMRLHQIRLVPIPAPETLAPVPAAPDGTP